MLHAALLLTIAIPSFIDPPDIEDKSLKRAFLIIMGASGFADLISILTATMFSVVLNRPYTAVDTMVARTKDSLFIASIVFDYLGMLTLMVATFICGFNNDFIDGIVHIYIVPAIIVMIYLWVVVLADGDNMQLRRCQRFKTQYCDESGMLKQEFIKKIYPPATVEELLDGIGLNDYSRIFTNAKITMDNCLFLEDSQLVELGITKLCDRMNLIVEFDRIRAL